MTQPTVLIAEDETDLLTGWAKTLSSAGYDVMTALDGQDALAQMRHTRPDLILSDVKMPVMNGYEFYKALRANPEWEFIPFIFLTAIDRPEEIREAKLLGVDDFLVKPINIDDLLVVVKAGLNRVERIRSATQGELAGLRTQILELLNHELRTPLQAIQGFSSLAADGGDEMEAAALVEMLTHVRNGSKRISRLIDDLLLVVEIQSGEAQRVYETRKAADVNVAALVAEAVSAAQPAAEAARVELRLKKPPKLPPIEADADYLRDAVSRLLDNAIKFSPTDSRVDVRVEKNSSELHICFEDRGHGIKLEQVAGIFDVFQQVDRTRQEQQGAGLGLTIARGLVRLHGGDVSAQSEPGKGSLFVIALPLPDA